MFYVSRLRACKSMTTEAVPSISCASAMTGHTRWRFLRVTHKHAAKTERVPVDDHGHPKANTLARHDPNNASRRSSGTAHMLRVYPYASPMTGEDT